MNTKLIPPVVALLASAIACIVSIVQHVPFGTFTIRLVVSALLFLTIGTIIKMVLDWALAPEAELPEDMEAESSDEAGETSDEAASAEDDSDE
ncbi:MAG: hypothetical protein IKR14_00730 [Lachnospiraceae bacterium]|jgi:hypothetical protein|nr:hypothetical protein [Lachnospiraceae bacterium]SFT42555.1 hypothetical protein SAMN02910301_0995 [Lachnospiraceae bacterium XBD2001]